MKVMVFQWPKGADAWRRCPQGPQPRIREDFERCHPGETLEDLKRRASFSKEDKGLLRDWMAIAASRAAADQAKGPQWNSAA
jgi:hypothetical protein